MDNDYIAMVERSLDDLRARLKAVEAALMQIPQITYQTDTSRSPGVVVEPAALVRQNGA